MSKEGNTGILRHFPLAAVDTTGLASQLPLSLLDAWAFPSWRGTWPLNQHFFASLLPFTFTKASKVSINSFNLGWLCKRPLSQRIFTKLSLFFKKMQDMKHIPQSTPENYYFPYFRVTLCTLRTTQLYGLWVSWIYCHEQTYLVWKMIFFSF